MVIRIIWFQESPEKSKKLVYESLSKYDLNQYFKTISHYKYSTADKFISILFPEGISIRDRSDNMLSEDNVKESEIFNILSKKLALTRENNIRFKSIVYCRNKITDKLKKSKHLEKALKEKKDKHNKMKKMNESRGKTAMSSGASGISDSTTTTTTTSKGEELLSEGESKSLPDGVVDDGKSVTRNERKL